MVAQLPNCHAQDVLVHVGEALDTPPSRQVVDDPVELRLLIEDSAHRLGAEERLEA